MMGTRHLIAVVRNGEYKIAQYGQWDGYPDGQGLTVLNFLKTCDIETFVKAVDNCTEATDDYIEKVDADPNWPENFPHFSRNTGADILQQVYDAGGLPLVLNVEFAADSLFCEWAYVIDLDDLVLEVYQGFNQRKPEGRFADMEPDGEYQAVTLETSFPLPQLPTEADFLARFEDECVS